MRALPPSQPPPWHTCRHPWRHRLVIGTVLGAWLYGALVYGLPWAVLLSRHFGPGINLLMFGVLGCVWILGVIPAGLGALYVLTLGGCGPWPSLAPPRAPTPPRPTRVERIIFSPEAAQQRFGVHGEIILEREIRAEREEP